MTSSQSTIHDSETGIDGLPTFWIRPATGWTSVGLKEVWEYRELLYTIITITTSATITRRITTATLKVKAPVSELRLHERWSGLVMALFLISNFRSLTSDL